MLLRRRKMSCLGRGWTSMLQLTRCCRHQSQLRFSTATQDAVFFHHIQSHNHIFPQCPTVLSVPDGFPFTIERGPKFDDIRLVRMYLQDHIHLRLNKFIFGRIPLLQLNGLITNHDQFMNFRMEAQPDHIRLNILSISDRHGRHVEGSEKYLETKGIDPSTVRILFDYLSKGMIPRPGEFPFEIKDGPDRATCHLRRKCENEIIMVKVRGVDEDRILDELAHFEAPHPVKSLKQSLDELEQHNFEEMMNIFDGEVGQNEEEVADIGCLLLSVSIYSGSHYSKHIKFDVFAFPDRIVVPRTTLSDHSRKDQGIHIGVLLDTYFKDRGIHIGTTNFVLKYIAQKKAEEEKKIKVEPKLKIFGRFDVSEMEAAQHRAEKRFAEDHGWTVL